jgi:hypothetical protein
MPTEPLEQVVRNIDARLARVEQILPALATKAELAEAVAPLATKAELAAAVAPLASRSEVREEGERTRRYFDVVAERLEGQIRLLADGQVALRDSMNEQFQEVRADIALLDRRVMRLEMQRGA